MRDLPRRLTARLGREMRRLAHTAVERGLPPAWFGYRWIRHETVPEHVARRRTAGSPVAFEVVHPAERADNPLPVGVPSASALPDERGWWGFSFRDVPTRRSSETFLATLRDCRVVSYLDPTKSDDFYPAIVTGDDRALRLREIVYRPPHAAALRNARAVGTIRLERATWILERVYHNHSHWLTAHLPKLLLLRDRDELDGVVLPRELTPAIDGSLRLLDLDPDRFPRYDPARLLEVGELRIVGSDRFRPELLRLVQDAFAPSPQHVADDPPRRRVYISRALAARRKLQNEDDVWPRLEREGFERVFMEQLTFDEQVALMRETAVLVAPHGAGMTNMVFCAPGTRIVEIADPGFPNPNFYALAAALGHRYRLLEAESCGDGRPLERDLRVDVERVARVVADLRD